MYVSVHEHISENTGRNFTKFSLHVTYSCGSVRSSSNGVAVHYVLPVLWMMSFFSHNGAYGGYGRKTYDTGTVGTCIEVSQLFHSFTLWSYTMAVNFAPGAKSAVYDCLVLVLFSCCFLTQVYDKHRSESSVCHCACCS